MTTERSVFHFINTPPPDGSIVESWPAHLTVIPPFPVDQEADTSPTLASMQTVGRSLAPIQFNYGMIRSGAIPVEVGKKDMFGEDNSIPVVVVEDPTGRLRELHIQLISALGEIGCNLMLDEKWSGENYSPHVSTKSGLVLDRPFFITHLSLVEKSLGKKAILATVDILTPWI